MARQVIKDTKERKEQRQRRTGMLISLFLMFLFILLTSSFVLRFIYQGASNVTITQDGIIEIYRAAMGDTSYSSNESAPFEDEYDEDYYDEDYYEDYDDYDGQLYTDGTGIYEDNGSTNNGQKITIIDQ